MLRFRASWFGDIDVKQNPMTSHSWTEIEDAINKALSELSGLEVTVKITSCSLQEEPMRALTGRLDKANVALTLSACDPLHSPDLGF
jgi:hypothetical protein